MREPKCEICGSTGFVSTVQFADYRPLEDGSRGHPSGLGYFCGMHGAEAFTHLSLSAAITAIHANPDRASEVPVRPPPRKPESDSP